MPRTPTQTFVNKNLHSSACSNQWLEGRDEAYKAYRRNWHEYPKNRHLSEFPLHLDIDVTNLCNLRCTMCARTILNHENALPELGYMDFGLFTSLIDQGVPLGLASIKLNFLGEPLLHPRIVDMVAYAKQAGVIDVMFNTNAMLLTPSLSEALLRAGLDSIFFSVDSVVKETLERIRVGARLETVLENIHSFLEARKRLGRAEVQVGVNMVLMEENKDELDDFLAYWRPLVDRVNWSHDHHYIFRSAGASVDECARLEEFCCAQLWQRAIVCVDGECLPCCLDAKRELSVGNAKTTPVSELWKSSPMFERLRRLHSGGDYKAVPTCRRCVFTLADIPPYMRREVE